MRLRNGHTHDGSVPKRRVRADDALVEDVLTLLDMASEDEVTIRYRLETEMPILVSSELRFVVLDLGARSEIQSATSDVIERTHRALRAAGSQLAVVGTAAAVADCIRRHPDVLCAASIRHALDAFGLGDPPSGMAQAPSG
jgi:hypothetical protein